MRASIKLITTERCSAIGYPIYVRLSHLKRRTKVCIGHSFIEFWNDEIKRPIKHHPNYFQLLPIVLDYKARIAKINYGDYSFSEASRILFSDFKMKPVAGLLAFFDVRIEEKRLKKLPFTSYVDVKKQVANYIRGNDIDLNDITYEWLNDFVLYKLQYGCKEGGVMSYLRTIRAVYKEAQRRTSLGVKQDNPFIGIIKNPTPKTVIEFPLESINKLLSFKSSKSTTKANTLKMERNIAVWLFQFYIGGHDYVDVARLRWTDLNKVRVSFRRYKLRNKKGGGPLVNNMLCKEALNITNKYGTKDSERIFGFIPDPEFKEIEYRDFRRSVARSLESISNQLDLPEALKTKSPRYIFRTSAGENLIHDLIVMKLQGHTPEGITFSYQGVISDNVLDEAHIKIITISH